jgi:hypothetical protein
MASRLLQAGDLVLAGKVFFLLFSRLVFLSFLCFPLSFLPSSLLPSSPPTSATERGLFICGDHGDVVNVHVFESDRKVQFDATAHGG